MNSSLMRMSFDINHGRNLLYVRGKFDNICVIVCFNKQHLLRICCVLSHTDRTQGPNFIFRSELKYAPQRDLCNMRSDSNIIGLIKNCCCFFFFSKPDSLWKMSFTFELFDFPIFSCWYYVNPNVQKPHFKENFKLWQTNF